jgi:hypothetical protein
MRDIRSDLEERFKAAEEEARAVAVEYDKRSGDRLEWDREEREFAAAWRSQSKWVVSRSLKSVGPQRIVDGDIEAVMRGLKARFDGEIDVGGPELARSLTDLV